MNLFGEKQTPKPSVKIPTLDLVSQTKELYPELLGAFNRVLETGHFILGADVQEFEKETLNFLTDTWAKPDTQPYHSIAMNSGTDALVIALKCLGIGPGDEVLCPSFSFFASSECIGNVGATPAFVDVDPVSFNIDLDALEKAITPRTRAMIIVHLYGRPVDMDRVMALAERHHLRVIEDCAQAFGATWKGTKVGTFGDFGTFSFFPSKNLGAFGDGGLLITPDAEYAEKARCLRAHGGKNKQGFTDFGYNSRLDTLQAAFLRVKLPHVPEWNRRRVEVAKTYRDLLGNKISAAQALQLPEIVDGHVFHQYTVKITDGKRDQVQHYLAKQGIQTMIYYTYSLEALPVYKSQFPPCTNSRQLSKEVLSLPIGPNLNTDTIQIIAKALLEALAF